MTTTTLPTYNVTKTFTSGLLKGLTLQETTTVQFKTGQSYKGTMGTSSYTVVSCVEV